MSKETNSISTLQDPGIPVQAKLAAAWTSFMFLYIYVDYLHLYKPGAIDDILAGRRLRVRHQPNLRSHCAHERGDPDLHGPALHDAARPCQPRHEPRRGNALHPILDVQRARRRVLDPLLRPRRRARSDPPRLHPPLRLDLAPHNLSVDARPRRTTPIAAPDGAVGPVRGARGAVSVAQANSLISRVRLEIQRNLNSARARNDWPSLPARAPQPALPVPNWRSPASPRPGMM